MHRGAIVLYSHKSIIQSSRRLFELNQSRQRLNANFFPFDMIIILSRHTSYKYVLLLLCPQPPSTEGHAFVVFINTKLNIHLHFSSPIGYCFMGCGQVGLRGVQSTTLLVIAANTTVVRSIFIIYGQSTAKHA